MRLSHVWLLTFLLGSFASCSDTTDVSGLWEMPENSAMLNIKQLDAPFDGRIKIAIDQFGWDISGIVLFYRDDIYYDLDSCHYVVDGEVRGDSFLFALEPHDGLRLFGSLEYSEKDGNDLLTGKLSDPDGVKPPLHVVLKRVGGDAKVHREEWDLGCQ
jgi:hypothetical protein